MAWKYTQIGPPFPFLGNLCESQKNAFSTWVTKKTTELPQIQAHHQIRAQQLRKTAGLLDAYYASSAVPDVLAHSFKKETWAPGTGPYFPYAYRNDHVPAMVVADVKENFRSHMVHMADGVFQMNQVRCMIEKQEDLAQHALDGVTKVPELMNKLTVLFGRNEYQAALVKDLSDLDSSGNPRFRVNQFEDPTDYERTHRTGSNPTAS